MPYKVPCVDIPRHYGAMRREILDTVDDVLSKGNDICYHDVNVKIIAVGGGFTYGPLGMSHHATEDIAILRALPNMTVVAPGDPVEAGAATRAVAQWPGPCYLRLGRAGEPRVHQSGLEFRIGKAICVRDGEDLTLISTGGVLADAVAVADRLREKNLNIRVLSMHTVKPLDTEAVLAAARETAAIATIEEHSIVGGLGSAVAEVLVASDGPKIPFTSIGLESAFASTAGEQSYLKEQFGLSIKAVIERLLDLAARSNRVH